MILIWWRVKLCIGLCICIEKLCICTGMVDGSCLTSPCRPELSRNGLIPSNEESVLKCAVESAYECGLQGEEKRFSSATAVQCKPLNCYFNLPRSARTKSPYLHPNHG